MLSCNFTIKMEQCVCHMLLVFLAVSVHHIYMSASISTSHNDYPLGTLTCKTHEMTKIDCSNRNLIQVPMLDQNSTTMLDLSHNNLLNITNAPFKKLQVLLTLYLSNNEISEMSPTAFRGLQSLENLDLQQNRLVGLPNAIFADLFNLRILDLGFNYFKAIPCQALASLYSLKILMFSNLDDISQIDFDGLQNLKNLTLLAFDIEYIGRIVTSDILQPLDRLPLTVFLFKLGSNYSISTDIFSALRNVTLLKLDLEMLPTLTSLNSPLQTLVLLFGLSDKKVVDVNTLKVIQKFNVSLTTLRIHLYILRRVEGHTFLWAPNLVTLDLSLNQISHLAMDAFYGLDYLQKLNLSHNLLTDIPSNTLEVFRNSASFQHLDLRSNRITGSISKAAFSAVSTSLTYLSVPISHFGPIDTNWLGMLENLKQITLTITEPISDVIFTSKQLPSLQTLKISNFHSLSFPRPMCTLFPNLQVAALATPPHVITKTSLRDMLEAFQGCSHLKELDLSGSLSNIKASELKHLNITISMLQTLKLAQNKVLSINMIFFIIAPKLAHLDLGDNLLTTIDSEIAYMYPSLISLDVQNNELESLAGLELLDFLQNLNAAGNKITVVPTWLLSEARSLRSLDLSSNSFQCTCGIQPFMTWILSDKQTWLQPGQYLCATPENLKGMSVTAIELDCKSKTALYLSIAIPSVLLFCVVIIILIRYRWHIKYKLFLLYRNYHPFPDIDEDFEMLQLQYHAYVAYNENSAADEAWVMDELQPNMEEGPDPIKLCIKSRDFIPGHFLLDSVDNSIYQSRKTILVLSPNFVESEWCYHEMRMAQMRLLDDNLDVLVLVLLNDIPENKMTLSLRQILCNKEYLKWPKDKAGQRLFWQRLREEVKGPVNIDRCFNL